MIFMVIGVLLGPSALDVIHGADDRHAIELLLEVTLALVLFTDSLAISAGDWRAKSRLPSRLLLIGMPLTMIIGWGRGIDPVPGHRRLGRGAGRRLPRAHRRRTRPGGCGDEPQSSLGDPPGIEHRQSGLDARARATPPLRPRARGGRRGWPEPGRDTGLVEGLPRGRWSWRRSLEELWDGSVPGRSDGVADRGWIGREWSQIATLALVLLVFQMIADTAEGSGFIATWVAGVTFGCAIKDRAPDSALFAEDLGGLLAPLLFLGFGAILLGPILDDVTWQTIVYAVLSLTVVRILPVAVSLLGTGLAQTDPSCSLDGSVREASRRSCSACSSRRKPSPTAQSSCKRCS